MAEKLMNFFYDRKSDLLYISIGLPQEAISKELGDDILIRVKPDTGEVIGFTILNFAERFSQIAEEHSIPVIAQFELPEEINIKGK